MKCKICGHEKEQTQIIMTFSITNPTKVEVEVDNNYSKLSLLNCFNSKEVLHKALDQTLDRISSEIFDDRMNKKK